MFASDLSIIELKNSTSGYDLERALRDVTTLSGRLQMSAEVAGVPVFLSKVGETEFVRTLDNTSVYDAIGVPASEHLAFKQLRSAWYGGEPEPTKSNETTGLI